MIFAESQNEISADARQNLAALGSSRRPRRDAAAVRLERLYGALLMMGDNQEPLDRKLNRRLEIEFYYPQRSLTRLK